MGRLRLYSNFIGIDIGKFDFVSFLKNGDKTNSYPNSHKGFQKFSKEHKDVLPGALVVLETTGGYEKACLDFLLNKKVSVHRADTRKVKSFIRSFGRNRSINDTLLISQTYLSRYVVVAHRFAD